MTVIRKMCLIKLVLLQSIRSMRSIIFLLLLCTTFYFAEANLHNAHATVTDTTDATSFQSSTENDQFDYLIENRKDPFVPFVTATATKNEANKDEIVEKNIKLTGMQLFEPGQLNLVGLLKSGGKQLAMVEDFTGKGYVISEGTKIGKRGTVIDIVPNKVIIEETAETRSGKKIVTKTVMVLKKEGEE